MKWLAEVHKRRDDLINDLFALLAIESVKDPSTVSTNKPMGENIAKSLETMLTIAQKAGFHTEQIEGYAGYADYGDDSTGEYIGVLGHLDVVPATGNWTYPPFTPTIADGKIYARGAIDDKGPTIAAFYALKIVKELNLPIKHNIRLIWGTDEESGMSCIRKYNEVEKMPIAGFSPDSRFPIIHAEKGQLNVLLTPEEIDDSEESELFLLSFHAGERSNMVPDLAKARITGKNEQIITEYEQYCHDHQLKYEVNQEHEQIEFILYGVSAHGAAPMNGINAGLVLANFLAKYSFNNNARTYLSFITSCLVDDCYGHRLGLAYKDEVSGPLTVNVGILRYEHQGEKVVRLNIRCPVTFDFPNAIKQLEETASIHQFTISTLKEKKPHYVDKKHPLIQVLQKVYHEETLSDPTLLSIGGATYAGLMQNVVAFGALFPGKPMTAHQQDEYIEIDDLLRATAIYARAIYELANTDFDHAEE